jgi:hypothetical protein
MQLRLAFFNPAIQPSEISAPEPTPAAWDHIDEASRLTALAILARLIAQMLAVDRKGASHD